MTNGPSLGGKRGSARPRTPNAKPRLPDPGPRRAAPEGKGRAAVRRGRRSGHSSVHTFRARDAALQALPGPAQGFGSRGGAGGGSQLVS